MLGINTVALLTAYTLPTRLAREFALIGDDESLATDSWRFYWLSLLVGVGRLFYLAVPFRARQYTQSALRTARLSSEQPAWYTRVGERFGSWFVASILSSENDKAFMQQYENANDSKKKRKLL